MEKKDMLDALVDYYSDGNKSHFARHIGVKPSVVTMWYTRNSFVPEVLFNGCDGISAEWLLSNGTVGSMLKEEPNFMAEEERLKYKEKIAKLQGEVKILREITKLNKKNKVKKKKDKE